MQKSILYTWTHHSPLSSTAYFTNYTNNGFSNKDQKELAEIFIQLDEKKCKVMLTNSNTSLVRELYANVKLQKEKVIPI
jgi:DNA adenine methylase